MPFEPKFTLTARSTPALRDWYRLDKGELHPTGTAIRHPLSLLVGERL